MADITRRGSTFTPVVPPAITIGGPSWMFKEMAANQQIVGLLAGEAILPCQPVYVKSDGAVWLAKAGEGSPMHGWSGEFAAASGQAVTVYKKSCGNKISYADATLTAGSYYYRSATTNGAVGDTATFAGTNDVQTLTNNGDAGTYTLGYGTLVTTALAFGANATTVQAALVVLFGTGNVTCTGTLAGGFTITFIGLLAGRPMGVLTFTNSMTNGGGATTGTIVHTTTGVRGSRPIAFASTTSILELIDAGD